jgi:hypothetical protein
MSNNILFALYPEISSVTKMKKSVVLSKSYVLQNHKKINMDVQLYLHKFTEDELLLFIDSVMMSRVYETQKDHLSREFIEKYIKDPNRHNDKEDYLTEIVFD